MNRSPMPRPGKPLPRYVPLASTTPLPPGNGPARRTPVRKQSAGKAAAKPQRPPRTAPQPPKAPGEFTDAVKLLVRKRAGRGDIFDAQCEACPQWLGPDAGEFQHRAARGAGGCRDAVINGPANCALMCPECHRKAEARDPRLGPDAGGFWLEHGTTPEYDPRNAPIMLHGADGGGTRFLAEDGIGFKGTGYLHQRPEAVAA